MQALKKITYRHPLFYLLIHSFIKLYIYRLAFVSVDTSNTLEKTCQRLWIANLCQYWCEKARKAKDFTDRHDMT